MTKILDIYLRRHMESYTDPLGKKHDGPSLEGIAQAQLIGEELLGSMIHAIPGVPYVPPEFYTSTMYRTQIAAELMAQAAGLSGVHTPVKALDPMKYSKRYGEAITAAAGSIENDRVAYVLTPENRNPADTETETPAAYAERILFHLGGLTKHFDGIQDGQTMHIENITHEPGLTAVVMRLLNMERYDPAVFHGAAKTAEAVYFQMEQQPSGLVSAEMRYRNLSSRLTM